MTQREKIREFDEEMLSYTGAKPRLAAGMFSTTMVCMMIIPYYDWNSSIICMLSPIIITVLLLLGPYQQTKGMGGKQEVVWHRLRYLPVSRKQWCLVQLGYALSFFTKVAIIGTLVQCVATCLDGRFAPQLVLYSLGMNVLVPMIIAMLRIVFASR